MRICSFVNSQGNERVGLAIRHPVQDQDWIFDPEKVEVLFDQYASAPTSPYAVSRPRFLETRPWPTDMIEFLQRSEETLGAAKSLQSFLSDFLIRNDHALLSLAGKPVESVKLLAPVPRPRILFGIVGNSPTFFRNNIDRKVVNIVPQGHARPQGSVVGPGEPVVVPTGLNFGWNPELGVVISKAGRNIPVEHARDHIAGLTVVLDISHSYYHNMFNSLADPPDDWFSDATASWLGKSSDTFCAMGPYITTLDEIGSIYDLLIYTRQSDMMRDRSHTNSMLIGVERLIHYMSTIMTLQPGDVLHLGTMGVDGMQMVPEMDYGAEDTIEGEIERVGVLRCPVVREDSGDWRSEEDPGKTVHVSPAARQILNSDLSEIHDAASYNPDNAPHFWTCYGNYRSVAEYERMERCSLPRLLNGPSSALSGDGSVVKVPAHLDRLLVSPEVCFVVKKAASRLPIGEAGDYVLGYAPLLAFFDPTLGDPIVEPATYQERAIPWVYGRWMDGFNVMGDVVPFADVDGLAGREIEIMGALSSGAYTTDEYDHDAAAVLSFLSGMITAFPGDVVTLGRVGELIEFHKTGKMWSSEELSVSVSGIGVVTCTLTTVADEYIT